MYRTLCVLAVLTLQAGLAHSFSWDIVAAAGNRLEFYNEEKLTYSVTITNADVRWITYDPFHNRVLVKDSNSSSVRSFDIATRKIQTLFNFQRTRSDIAYDPATSIFFAPSTLYRYALNSFLVKPGSDHDVDVNFATTLGWDYEALAVDSCRRFIYWIRSYDSAIRRSKFRGSVKEEVIESTDKFRFALTIDPQTQNMYWTEFVRGQGQYFILSADLDGKHRKTLYHGEGLNYPPQLTVSKDFIYWSESYITTDNKFFWKFPKNPPLGTDVKPKRIAFNNQSTNSGNTFLYIAANYAIEEQPEGTPLCKALKSLLPNHTATNDSDSLNVSTSGSLLRVNGTKVSGESRVSGDIFYAHVCQYYCLQGNCCIKPDGQPICRCNAGYSGVRCEVNECQNYCLNGGVCSLSEENNPLCQCTGGYQGERCDVPDFLIKCSQTVSFLKDILNADTEDKGANSSCASTVF